MESHSAALAGGCVGEKPEHQLCWGRVLEWPPLGEEERGPARCLVSHMVQWEEEKGLKCN